jgi:hypothetical protein
MRAFGADPAFHLFLLLGQSNMAGAPPPETSDLVSNPRVQVLAYGDCAAHARTYDAWAVAAPPLHGCDSGLGPGDHNALVNTLPRVIANAHIASASGLAGFDDYHFDVAGQRELGRRYAQRMLDALARRGDY